MMKHAATEPTRGGIEDSLCVKGPGFRGLGSLKPLGGSWLVASSVIGMVTMAFNLLLISIHLKLQVPT